MNQPTKKEKEHTASKKKGVKPGNKRKGRFSSVVTSPVDPDEPLCIPSSHHSRQLTPREKLVLTILQNAARATSCGD